LLSVIDECLSEAEPRRKYVATLAAVTNARSEPGSVTGTSSRSREDALTN
jgi:hypothetical protein